MSGQMSAVVVAHGDADRADRAVAAAADLLVAADGGALVLGKWKLTPHLVVGDMDSLDAATLADLARRGAEVHRYPAEKDESDLELALAHAVAAGARRVVVLGAFGGGRLDYTVANALLLADERWRGVDLRARKGGTTVRALHAGEPMRLEGAVGDRVTILPATADLAGVTSRGLRYGLDGDALALGRARGVSNAIVALPASLGCERGIALVFESALGRAHERGDRTATTRGRKAT